jgi:hypothetical protein
MTAHALPATRPVARVDLLRLVAVVGLAVTAAVHVPVAADHVGAARYLLLSFDVMVVVSAGLAALLTVRPTRPAAAAAMALALAAIAAYVASRTVGLPLEDDDVGDWTNALGLVALGAETAVVLSAALLLRRRRT